MNARSSLEVAISHRKICTFLDTAWVVKTSVSALKEILVKGDGFKWSWAKVMGSKLQMVMGKGDGFR